MLEKIAVRQQMKASTEQWTAVKIKTQQMLMPYDIIVICC